MKTMKFFHKYLVLYFNFSRLLLDRKSILAGCCIVILNLLFFSNYTKAQTNFCASSGQSQNYEWMYGLRLSTNSSYSDGELFDLGSATRVGYKDWTATQANTFPAGATVYYTLYMNSTSSYNQQIYFWLDKNQDASVTDPDERVHTTSKDVNGSTTHQGSFTMPASSEIGSGTVFGRIIMRFSSAPPLCGNYDYGTTFDFRINVTGGTLNTVQSTISVTVSGTGLVTSNPAGINTTSSQTANFSPNKSVSLTATGSGGAAFAYWTGTGITGQSSSNPLTFTTAATNETRNYTAVFGDPCQASSIPSTASASATSTTSANLTWSASTGTSPITYYWAVKKVSDASTVANGNTTTTSATSSSLAANTSYYLQVYSNNCSGNSGTVNSSNFSTYPSDPTSVSASVNPLCTGSSTQLTAAGTQGTVYWYTASCGGTQVTTGNPITVSPSATTTYYARNYNNSQFSAGCASVIITVNPLLQYRTVQSGNWTTLANWQQFDGTSWIAATSYPGQITNSCSSPLVTIQTGHQMEINDVNITIPNLKVEGIGKLTIESTGKIFVSGQLQLDANASGAIVVN
jgi:hypothetical protein